MHIKLPTGVLLVINLTFCLPGHANCQDDLSDIHRVTVSNAANKVAPSVIQIETIGGVETVGETQTSSAPTTALIVSSDGYALSSEFNFVKEPAAIFARLPDGQRVNVSIVARDTNRKLVLLKLDKQVTFPVPEFVDREDLVVGQSAIALGRAYQHDSINVSTGIISATHRVWSKAVQTDAKISPANYGGPLVNLNGQVVGLLVPLSPRGSNAVAGAEWYDSGIGFAVTLKPVLEKLDTLKSGQDLRPGLLGVSFKGTNMYRGEPEISVCPGHTPAGQAGMKPGDVITKIDGQAVIRQAQLRHLLGPKYAGDEVSVTVLRDDTEINITTKLVAQIDPFQPVGLGILPARNANGVIVGSIIKGGPAETAALAPGDQITKLNGVAVSSVEEIEQQIVGLEIGAEITITFLRENENQSAKLSLGPLTGELVETVGSRPNDLAAEEFNSQVKVPEFANESWCYLPKRGQSEELALMVWVPEAGPVDHERIWQQWKTHCDEYGIALLVPLAMDRKRWSPGEEEFIAAAINEVKSRFEIDNNRVAVAGAETGGSMAALVASQNREMVKGLGIIDSGLPRAAVSMQTDPNQKMFLFFGSEKEGDKATSMKAIGTRMIKRYFPVHSHNQPENPNWPGVLSKWLNSIDRF